MKGLPPFHVDRLESRGMGLADLRSRLFPFIDNLRGAEKLSGRMWRDFFGEGGAYISDI